jgi:hypothetical protein
VGVILTRDEKYLARILFKILIHESDGMAFQRLFTDIMNYAESDFQPIKPWGNVGDRKNDGYIKSKGTYYQVFAPEDSHLRCSKTVSKLKDDFTGLLSQWSPVNEFYFLVNDKYKGVPPDVEIMMNQLIANNKPLKGGVILAKYLEDKLFSLADDQILAIVGQIPDPSKVRLDYNILNEVIKHIIHLPLSQALPPDIKMPDWDQKIRFNQLSEVTAIRLNNGYLQINNLQKYLDNNSDFLADNLRDKMNEIYISEKRTYSGDELFWAIVKKASPINEAPYQSAVIVIMAKYFEACDIFERPDEVQNDSTN